MCVCVFGWVAVGWLKQDKFHRVPNSVINWASQQPFSHNSWFSPKDVQRTLCFCDPYFAKNKTIISYSRLTELNNLYIFYLSYIYSPVSSAHLTYLNNCLLISKILFQLQYANIFYG